MCKFLGRKNMFFNINNLLVDIKGQKIPLFLAQTMCLVCRNGNRKGLTFGIIVRVDRRHPIKQAHRYPPVFVNWSLWGT